MLDNLQCIKNKLYKIHCCFCLHRDSCKYSVMLYCFSVTPWTRLSSPWALSCPTQTMTWQFLIKHSSTTFSLLWKWYPACHSTCREKFSPKPQVCKLLLLPSLNYYCPITLTSEVIKCLEKLVRSFTHCNILSINSLYPHTFLAHFKTTPSLTKAPLTSLFHPNWYRSSNTSAPQSQQLHLQLCAWFSKLIKMTLEGHTFWSSVSVLWFLGVSFFSNTVVHYINVQGVPEM